MNVRAVVFDAYGTLFDVNTAVLEASLPVGLEDQAFSNLWRQRQLEFTWLWSLMGKYEDFWSLTRGALHSALRELGVDRDEAKLDRLMQAYWTPRVFPDVMPALDSLVQLPLVILSNGSPEMLRAAVRHNRLESRFQEIISVDRVKTYKPSPQVYALGTDVLRFSAAETLFVSSNWWDAWGARRLATPSAGVIDPAQKSSFQILHRISQCRDSTKLLVLFGLSYSGAGRRKSRRILRMP